MDEQRAVEGFVGRAVWYVRVQRGLAGLLLGAAPGGVVLAVAMVAVQLRLLDAGHFPALLVGAGAVAVVGLLVGLLWRVDRVRVAYRLDRANDNADRLGSALELGLQGGPPSPYLALLVRAASERLPALRVAPAFPWRLPRGARLLLLALLVLTGASLYQAPPLARPLPPPPPPMKEQVLGAHDLQIQREELQRLRRLASETRDEQLAAVAERFAELLDSVEQRTIEREEAIAALQALASQAATTEDQEQLAEVQALGEDLAEAAKELAREKETKPLAEALQRQDHAGAARQLKRLAEMLGDDTLSRSRLERLARMFGGLAERLARKLAPKQLRSLQRELSELQRRVGKRALSAAERERFKALEEAVKKGLGRGGAKDPQPRDPSLRALDQLKRRAEDASQQMKKAAQGKGRGRRGEEQAQQGRQGASKAMRQGASSMEQLAQAGRQSGQRAQAAQRLQQAREAVRRGGSPRRSAAAQERQLRTFDERARAGDKAPGGQQRGQAGQRRSGQRQAGGQPGEPSGKPGSKPGDRQGGRQAGQLQRRGEQGDRKGTGTAAGGDSQGDATDTPHGARFKDERLTGAVGGGDQREEVLLGAAEQGFARAAYRDVFVEYEQRAEEELQRVHVPPGFRYYMRRYFELIRPRDQ